MICDCGHDWDEHASGPDDDTTECLHDGCECPTFVIGDEVEVQSNG